MSNTARFCLLLLPFLGGWTSVPLSEAYSARQSEYLTYCSANMGPGVGSTPGQLCRLKTGEGPINEDAIRSSLSKINNREDTADFGLNAILRMLLLYNDSPYLDGVREEMKAGVIGFKYWLDQPGEDQLCWWSENHQILFHTAELLAGRLYPTEVFTNTGWTGEQHAAHALPLVEEWLDRRARFGFSEWHSNVYYNEDIPALVNLVDLAGDERISLKAAMVLDVLSLDLANLTFNGQLATTLGRSYKSAMVGGRDSTSEAAWLLLGQGSYQDTGNFSASFLVTSDRYWPAPIMEGIAQESRQGFESRQRDGINIEDGPGYGIGYESPEDVMFWWGMGAYAADPILESTLDTVEYYDLWDDYFWSDYQYLRIFVGADWLNEASAALEPFTRGSALESVSVYTWRTPEYQLSGAQDFHPGWYGAQQVMWQAMLDPTVRVYTTWPGGQDDEYAAGSWTGGWLPRATFHQNVGIIQYFHDAYPYAGQALLVPETHAYFPRSSFDEVREDSHWLLGRKGAGYVGLYSAQSGQWAVDAPQSDYEWIASGPGNVWIVELGSERDFGSFDAFASALIESEPSVRPSGIRYDSPSQGRLEVDRTGPLLVEGQEVDLGPYPRFENPYVQQEFGETITEVTQGGETLLLDFSIPERQYGTAAGRVEQAAGRVEQAAGRERLTERNRRSLPPYTHSPARPQTRSRE